MNTSLHLAGIALALCVLVVPVAACSDRPAEDAAPEPPPGDREVSVPAGGAAPAKGAADSAAAAPTPGAVDPGPATQNPATGTPGQPVSAPVTHRPPEGDPAAPVASPAAEERIEIPATKPGLARVGPEKCKMCHKVQYQSWAESGHAQETPPLDCESCHGPGSEYKALAVMKDPERARQAGLVTPDEAFCTASCHGDRWEAGMLAAVHAHTPDA